MGGRTAERDGRLAGGQPHFQFSPSDPLGKIKFPVFQNKISFRRNEQALEEIKEGAA
jgi:hypothetical protein